MEYSVIIPTHNRPELLLRALRSVREQTRPATAIIIIDDASEPPLALPEEYLDERTHIIRHEQPVGGAAARNSGLDAVTTAVVAFLDDDDEWLPRKMEIQLAWLAAHPRATLVTCGHVRHEAGRKYLEVFAQEFVERYCQYDNFFGSFSYLVVRSHAAMRLDAGLPACQDWDFALRVTRGHPFGVIEEPLVNYYAHNLPRITNRAGNSLRGLRRCFVKHRFHFSPDVRCWLLGRIIFEKARLIESRRRRFGRVMLAIRLAARCDVPAIMKLRVIARRAASLGVSQRTVVAVRSAMISTWQTVQRLLHPAPHTAASHGNA
jgi:glycosyltransferase involved in cell wall biosynthesis